MHADVFMCMFPIAFCELSYANMWRQLAETFLILPYSKTILISLFLATRSV